MKKLLLSLAVIAATFTSCSDDDNNNSNNAPAEAVLPDEITENMTLNAGTVYTLMGPVYVKSGVTLTIPAGTRIEGYAEEDAEEVSFLAVETGGKIIAQGTAENPIVMTSSKANPQPGDWGGLVVCGLAQTNLGTGVSAEVTGLTYGGTNSADNSGVYSYIVLEYAGALINQNAEFNGFTFYAVGSGTTVNNLLAYQGSDDGFEWFGGSVNATNLAAIGCQDDSFDWTEGWNGTVTNLYSDQSVATAFSADSRGIEADSNQNNETQAPISNPTLKNITLIGRNNAAVTSEAGIMLRRGTKGMIDNVYIANFKSTASGSYAVNFSGTGSQAHFTANPVTKVKLVNNTADTNIAAGISIDDNATGAGNGATAPTWMDWMGL
ncbi:hypothetical protein LRS05_01550 [Flavobacterium sp. J372]|uniref:hypothetical protein n=1 Tax=Flavobacterium sp. J372 TaxID=2898436 RepID=UPI002151238C|nr:hypothetical protein [Flavobacterium sp. J372]MCR5860908.1 hypothetical protein [Flavobacterium sp. J372]